MFKFQHPYYLYALLLLALFTVLFLLVKNWKRKTVLKMGEEKIVQQLFPDFSSAKFFVKFLLISLAFVFIVFGIANPQVGNKIEKVKRKGIDVIIALDVSRSMNAEDVQPSRLARAKQAINQLIDKLESDRVGLIVFAGRSYLQMPLTTDYGAAKMYVNNINTDLIPSQGTAIGTAIDLAKESFQVKEKKYKALVIITDGEDQDEDAVEAAKSASETGVIINTVGVGLPEGAPIPVIENGENIGYKKDGSGNTVMSKLNEEVMKGIATAGGGNYYHLGNSQDEIKSVVGSIEKMEQRTLDEVQFTDYESYFQYFLFIGLLLLIIEWLIFETKTQWHKKMKWAATILVLILFSETSSAQILKTQPERKIARSGNDAYNKKDYTAADSAYRKALSLDKNLDEAAYNLGNSLYQQKKYEEAAKQFAEIAEKTADKNLKAKAYHNLGNSQLEQRKYQEALDAYKNALKNNSTDKDTKYNYEYSKRMMQAQQQKQKNDKNKKDDKKKDDKNQDNKNQKDKDKQEQQKKQQEQQKKDEQKKKEQQQKQGEAGDKKDKKEGQQPQAGKIKKEEADRLLQAIRAQEQKTKNNLEKKKLVVGVRKMEKDW